MTFKTVKLVLQPLSAFKSEFQSDTIFGMFAWTYKYIYGDDKLKEFLNDFSTNPSIIFSDGFLESYLPRPFLMPLTIDDILEMIKDTQKENEYKESHFGSFKKIKNFRFLPVEVLNVLLKKGLTEKKVVREILKIIQSENKENNRPPKMKKASFIKNSINRLTNNVEEGLYQSLEIFYNTNIEIYLKYNISKITLEEIEEVFEVIGDFGFGADKSTGKGRFKLKSIEKDFLLKDFMEPEKAFSKYVMSLSSALILNDDIELMFGKTFVKFGKLGGDKAYKDFHFKNPIVLYKPGSTFKVKEKKHFYGNATSDVFIDKEGVHSGFFIPLFFNYSGGD